MAYLMSTVTGNGNLRLLSTVTEILQFLLISCSNSVVLCPWATVNVFLAHFQKIFFNFLYFEMLVSRLAGTELSGGYCGKWTTKNHCVTKKKLIGIAISFYTNLFIPPPPTADLFIFIPSVFC